MNFVICGLPRSGTTIIARFIGALDGVTVLHEPYQLSVFKKQFPPQLMIPKGCVHFGFKEPFYAVDKGCQIQNDGILKAYKKMGWRFIWVTRNPGDVFRSIMSWAGGYGINAFVANWHAFQAFRNNEPSIDYGLFCKSPSSVWNSALPLPIKSSQVKLDPVGARDDFFGDCRAYSSTEIIPAPHRQVELSEYEIDEIRKLEGSTEPAHEPD